MTERERKQYIEYMILKDELEEERNKGYALEFAGQEASADEIARICIFQEESSFMRDYGSRKPGKSRVLNVEPLSL